VSTVIEDLKHLEDRILTRIAELESCVAELEQLREVAARLGILDASGRDTAPAADTGLATDTALAADTAPAPATATATATARGRRRRPGPRVGARTASANAAGAGARARGARSATRGAVSQSTRRERVLEVVGVEPGISVREVVAQLGVNRTSLYPVVRQLVNDGLLYKEGRGLWPAAR
jgi:hypothetical protein